MIPVRLWLKNFLSYGEDLESLDFTSFKLACLSGRNGHGKSALIDAMTWAVWGEARKASFSRTPDSDLIRQGAENMAVEFTFLIDDREYQVYREYSARRQSSKVEFRARKGPGEPHTLLTGGSKRDTQKRILETVGLDFRTFRNSSLLLQGKANEFTVQSPKDRKDILCNILGLEYYDRLQEESKQRLSASKAEKKALEAMLSSVEQDLAREPEVIKQEEELTAQLQEKETALAAARETEKELREKIAQLQMIRERIQRWQEDLRQVSQLLRDAQSRGAKLQAEQTELQGLASHAAEIEEQFKRYEQVALELKNLLEIETQFQGLDRQRQDVQQQIEKKRSTLREALASLTTEQGQIKKILEECEALLKQRESIEEIHRCYLVKQEQLKAIQALRPRYEQLQAEKLKLEAAIEKERQTLSEAVAELRGRVNRMPKLQKEIEEAQKKVVALPRMEIEFKEMQAQLEQIVEQGQAVGNQIECGKGDLAQTKKRRADTLEKLIILQKSDSADCPLCKQDLKHGSREEIERHFQEEIGKLEQEEKRLEKGIQEGEKKRQDLLKRHKALKEQIAKKDEVVCDLRNIEQNLHTQQEEIKHLETDRLKMEQQQETLLNNRFALEPRTQLEKTNQAIRESGYVSEKEVALNKEVQEQSKNEVLWSRLQDAILRKDQAEKRNAELTKQIEARQTSLTLEDFAVTEKQRLQEVLTEIEPLRKALEKRKPLQDEQYSLRNAPSERSRLHAAQKRLPELAQEQATLSLQQLQNEKRLADIQAELKAATPQLQQLEETEKKRKEQEAVLKGMEAERNAAQMQLGGVKEKRAQIEKLKEEQKASRERLIDLGRDERVYDILRAAFSRDGIPAMIVEQSLPELEADANRLLQRLTHGAFSIAMESQRITKAGGMSETLDIRISDEMGTRNYEMFSGGEAFRTDLAIRIALSQLLCRRAGRRLQMLVIDEGFGTQDTEGLNNIVDAIADIQDEFEKILVVTHLEELKEKFLVRIEVTKEPGIGSKFEVVHTM